jgi:hypothetical protein
MADARILHNGQKGRREVIASHREIMLQRSIDRLLAGEVPPEYVTERGNKLKEITKRRG